MEILKICEPEISYVLVNIFYNCLNKSYLIKNKNTLTGMVNCKKVTRHHAHQSL